MKLWFADTGQEASQDCDSKRRKTSTIAPNYCPETASTLSLGSNLAMLHKERDPQIEPVGLPEMESQKLKLERPQ